jgi:hypothetical protein
MAEEASPRPYADPEAAARRILEIAKEIEAWQGRIYVDLINGPFLHRDNGSPAELTAGLDLLIQRRQLVLHEGCGFVQMPETGGLLPHIPPE